MHQRAVGVVHIERTARAALLPVRTEHEVVDNQLAVAVEKLRERHLPVRPVENVIFFDFDPRKLARSRVSRFSLSSSFLRAASHSTRDTIFGLSFMLVDILISPFI